MQSPNAVIRFKLYNLLNSNFFSNQEKSLLIVFSYICNRIETTLSKTYLEKKEAFGETLRKGNGYCGGISLY